MITNQQLTSPNLSSKSNIRERYFFNITLMILICYLGLLMIVATLIMIALNIDFPVVF